MSDAKHDDAMRPLAPGALITIGAGQVSVDIAPEAGGRVAQIRYRDIEQLIGHGESDAMIAWGCYPMAPWAGRIRHGRFDFGGRTVCLPLNLGRHAIHGVAFAMPWQVDAHSSCHVELSLSLPEDERWPYAGIVRQQIDVAPDRLRMALSVAAGEQAMPITFGWHPWLRKPDRIEFAPDAVYPRDAEGIATLPLAPSPPGPWDDCFINRKPVLVHHGDQVLRLTSNCSHWVVYDEPSHATCIEPQSGPPDAFNLVPNLLGPGETVRAWFLWEWIRNPG